MTLAHDDPPDTPRQSDTSYPPRQTGKYRIRDLPTEVPLPVEVKGKPNERFFVFVQDQFHRQDAITKEERFALAAYRSYVDETLDVQAREAGELREMVVQAIGVLHDLGATVSSLKELPGIVSELSKDVRQLRRCMRKLENTVHLSNNEVKNIGLAAAEFEGRISGALARLETSTSAQLESLWTAVHRLEEELEIRDDAEDDAETDEAGPSGSAPTE